ncbi:hypothetical protein CEUSTIGMA_g10149.t1 [Chlamydomonas eustigma]|uniref:SET domain-containing protein n=1 Tax=Chlamydomonas eustigma TaxID=1157962 RepID=A0A250XI51_9CHLO|nr:hypothetical protein CEUSTIGMA_g10149.t1 [Chlamydomonas eustigma]|eukprot:GAX82723.1 hypothetical protein CEUSTIGMA_g10149.t1 [Chlamydomonas eustigma]
MFLPSSPLPRLRRRGAFARGIDITRNASVELKNAAKSFNSVMESVCDNMLVEIRPSKFQNGLYTKHNVLKGQVLLSVPPQLCISVDFGKENGLSLPSGGSWPRLQAGLEAPDPLTWDLLMSLALLDCISGNGGQFWMDYSSSVFPEKQSLLLPMCWPMPLLRELQHPEIMEGALKQQARLSAMFPDLMAQENEDVPSWFQWAFACVRSRSVQLSRDHFALVPFLDLANHGIEANCDFAHMVEGDSKVPTTQLVALQDMPQGTELLLSYTGPNGYTNQRMMAQYGFVIPGGNPGDRIIFKNRQGLERSEGVLKLERFQDVLGDQIFLEIISGKDAYGYAALKSLPIGDENSDGSSADDGDNLGCASSLRDECKITLEESASTLQEDEELLAKLIKHRQPDLATEDSIAPLVHKDERFLSALMYRIERKRLLHATSSILSLYIA